MLLYSIIARSSDGIVLVEATTAGIEGNHPQITNQLVQKLVAKPSLVPLGIRKTFANNVQVGSSNNNNIGGFDDDDIEMKGFWNGFSTEEIYDEREVMEHFFHVQRDESVYFICLSDDRDGQQHRINYSFLNDVQKEFSTKYTPNKIMRMNAYGLEKQFKRKLNSMMHHCNTNRNPLQNTQTSHLNAKVESLKKIMGTNIDLMMRSETNIEDLVETTDDLLEESKIFKKNGRRLKGVMKRKERFYKLILVGFALLTIYLMVVTICGFDMTCTEEHDY